MSDRYHTHKQASKPDGLRVLGIDASLNHSGLVLCDEDGLLDYHYITERAGDAKAGGDKATRWKALNTKDKHRKALYRLDWMSDRMADLIMHFQPTHIVLEGYAFDTHGAHQMGELGGMLRLMTWRSRIPQRWHDPLTVKMFAAHKGNASKAEVQQAVADRWGIDFSATGKQGCEDLADAYVLATMGVTEVMLRDGRLLMSDLHPKEVQVFNRTTKTAPISVLGREWLAPEQT